MDETKQEAEELFTSAETSKVPRNYWIQRRNPQTKSGCNPDELMAGGTLQRYNNPVPGKTGFQSLPSEGYMYSRR